MFSLKCDTIDLRFEIEVLNTDAQTSKTNISASMKVHTKGSKEVGAGSVLRGASTKLPDERE